jgi:predicted ATPase/DNA-binding SARP family transcriptional activator
MASVHLQLLDDVVVTADGARTAIGGPRQRALVARLALDRGRSIPLDRLIDDLWDGAAAEIRTTLRAYMSRLRTTAIGPWLSGGRSGYRLADGPALSVDLWSLEDAVARGAADDDVAVPHVLANWHDAPLGGIGVPPFVEAARERITRAVHAARLQAARAALEAGRIDSALLLLHPLRAAHPDDEDLLALVRVAETRAAVGDRAFHSLAVRDASGEAALGVRPAAAPDHQSHASPMTRRTGIPAPIAGIVGRSEERAALTAALDVSRLVTLTGPAGVGKTRLAVDWLGSSAAAGEEHIWFVSLGALAGEQVGERIAAVIGAPDASVPGIAAHLADRRGILVLDGADAVASEAAAVATAVLSNARGLAVLSTSRRTLDVPGESVLRVDPLLTAEARALLTARLLGDPPETGVADRLVEQLGRLPLAIELAAARAAVMPLDEVAESMLRDLHPPMGTAEAPLASALRSSLQMLASERYDTLRAVAGFAGPFTRAAVAAVCGERNRDRDLDHLVAASLVAAEDGGGGPVFRVSELVRRAVLRGAPPDEDWSRRHREWFAAQSTRASVELTAQGSAARIAQVRAEWPDVVAAFDSAVRADDRASATAIAGGLLWFAVRSGRQQELLALTRRAGETPGRADAAAEAQLCLARGFLAYQLGSMPEAATWISAAGDPAERSSEPGLRGLARAFAAYLLTLAPRSGADAESELSAALSDLERMPDTAASMVMLIGGQVLRNSGSRKEAIALLDRAGSLASRCGHDWVALMAPVVVAKVHLDLRQGAPAVAALAPVVRRSAEDGDPVSLLIAASVAAGAAAALGEDAAGARIIGAVDAIGRRYGFDPRANEPADFELYLRRVREGLTPAEWRSAYAHGLQCEVEELVDLVSSLSPR